MPAGADEPFDYFRNSWNVLGLKDYEHGTRVAPDNKLLFTTNGVSGDVTVIDVDALKAVKTIKVGRFPWGAAARP